MATAGDRDMDECRMNRDGSMDRAALHGCRHLIPLVVVLAATAIVVCPSPAVGWTDGATALDALREGYAALDSGRYDEAETSYRRALEVATTDQERFQALFGLAAAEDGRGDRDAACDDYAAALSVRPDNRAARRTRAAACAAAGRLDEAIAELERLTAADPDDLGARRDLIVAYAMADQHARSEAAARELLADHPDDLAVRLSLGLALYHLGRYPEAAVELRRVVRASPDNHGARLALGLALLYGGDREGALQQYGELKTAAPDLAAELYRSLFPQ